MGAAQPDPYGQSYGMQPNPYGGSNYGHPPMMGGQPHMHGSNFGSMGSMGGSSGRAGLVPFRPGDWKCGNEGCQYHNFAKNVSCLRCGASRSNAAVVAEGGMTNFPGSNYGGPQGPPAMTMGSMDSSSYGGMTQGGGSAYGGGNMGAGFGGQNFGPPSTYALPSGLGAPSPYMAGGYSQMASNGGMQAQGGFDSRAEQAFNQGNSSSAGGQGGYSNGGYGNNQYGNDGAGDPFGFLSSGMNNLDLGGGPQNGGAGRGGQGNTKSPQ